MNIDGPLRDFQPLKNLALLPYQAHSKYTEQPGTYLNRYKYVSSVTNSTALRGHFRGGELRILEYCLK